MTQPKGTRWDQSRRVPTPLRAAHSKSARRQSTAAGAWPHWLEFLIEAHGPSTPLNLRPEHVKSFINWLRRKYPFRTSAHTTYAQVKPMLVSICERGMGPSQIEGLFPVKALVNRAGQRQSPIALSHAEILRLADALKRDLIAIHRDEFSGPDSEALVVSFLVIALRTGINTTPLLEAKRDCLSPNPFTPNMIVIRAFKRRGKGQQSNPLRQSDGELGTTLHWIGGCAAPQAANRLHPKLRSPGLGTHWSHRGHQRICQSSC